MTSRVRCEYFLDFFRALFDCSRIEILRPIFLQPSRGIPDFVNRTSFLVRVFRPSREYFHASMAFLLDINPFCKEGRPKERATLLAHSFHGPIANFPILQISRRVSLSWPLPESQFGAQMGQIRSTNRLSPHAISPADQVVTLPNQSN